MSEPGISLEETNKIRISLGLKPLTDDGPPVDSKEQQAENNYAKKREQETKDREAKALADKIAKVKNRRELNASLKGATLGDADADTDDPLKWIKRSKKKEKELAKKRLQEQEHMDKMFQGDEYTERDLAGLKVSHDFDEMDEGEARILTLKDSRILDNEEDELQNVEMAEAERTKRTIELKQKRHEYKGYDDDEFVEGNQGMKRSILAKYDEELDGSTETGFRLGGPIVSTRVKKADEKEAAAASVNKSLLNIDYAKNIEMSDYLQEGDVGFKKPRTKKKRNNRRVPEIEEPSNDEMEVDQVPIVRDMNANFVDDDELQAALARSRKAKIRKANKLSPEELAEKIAAQRAAEEEPEDEVREETAGNDEEGLTFDDTSEFVRTIGLDPINPVKQEARDVKVTEISQSKRQSEPRDVSMEREDEPVEELEAGEVVVKDEEEEDMAMLDRIEDALKQMDAEEDRLNGDDVGTSSEQTFGSGMASTLNILRQQGILAPQKGDQKGREHVQLQRDLWLSQQRHRIAQREVDKLQSRGGNKDQSQREYENRLREQQEARDNLDAFKNYKPDVNIVYYDEFGRELTPKEAWKALSHKFHGKGSGKMKTEKRLKKIAEEKKKEAMASGDTPLSMNKAFQQRQEKAGQAHFVLSVGNRGAVPQVETFLESQPLAKGKTEKNKKKKEAAGKGPKAQDAVFMTLPAPQSLSLSNGASPGPSGYSSGAPTTSNSPAPKAGFSRISSTAFVEAPSQGSTPAASSSERSKVAFGFGIKRKAGEDAEPSPPPKRR
ncbi:SART-1-domain-containing protein [Pluteus cervinus]|uniref:SART-1-domain-containing protein n=1 Tax=Pluteus cervinus TaxID=181527 RepID=A0ACD3BBD8_9AGAR|nr:SART-1-domain-containing protein [Pluteus cervinus]